MALFRCPTCHNPLTHTDAGTLMCTTHGEFAKSPQGFLSFLPQGDAYFTQHWTANQLPEIPPAKIDVAKRFLAPMLSSGALKTCLDVGTGDGVHLAVIATLTPSMRCYGLDISPSALATAHARTADAVLMLADAQAIPMSDNGVDAVFSYGVLAYLPSPWQGLAEMVRVTKPGGLIGVWMYPKTASVLGRLFGLVRSVVSRLPRFLQARVADCIVPFLGFLPTESHLHLGNANWAACREIVLVNIAPPHLIFPTADELRTQLATLGCRIVQEDAAHPLTFWAVKE